MQILGLTWKDKITNAEIQTKTNQRRLQVRVAERRLSSRDTLFARHQSAALVMPWIPTGGKRGRGRSRKTWRSTLKEDLHRRWTTWDEAKTLAAADLVIWRNQLAIVPQGTGGSSAK